MEEVRVNRDKRARRMSLQLVLEATATVVCLNKDYRPTRVFPEVASKLRRFFSS